MTHALIVDDEPAIASAITAALERESITTTHAETLQDARPQLTSTDIIILDVGLPDGSGLDLLREIKSIPPHIQPDVLILSARGDELDRVLGLELGAEDYMVKPFSPRELIARVRVILRRRSRLRDASTEQRIPSVACSIDSEAMRIYFHGYSLDLTRQEYRLLEVLIEQAGIVCSRARLLDLAWDDPSSTIDRAVDTLIKSIRSKIQRVIIDNQLDNAQDPIRTVRGEGYCLES